MRGSIIKRSKRSWALVVDQGRDASGKRKQKWVTFEIAPGTPAREAQKQAEAKLAELLDQANKGTFIDASKTTLVEYLRDAKAPVATVPLQKVRASDLEAFYATVKLAPSSVNILHAVVHRALKTAVRDRLIVANPAAAVESRPRPSRDHGQGAREHCWSAEEARTFLAVAREAGPQGAAFYTIAIDTGARKSELLGLTWTDLDLDAGTVTIARQLEPAGASSPTWGPTKTGKPRTVTLGPETIVRLKAHRKHQRELLMANRTTYTNHGLVFAREHADLQTPRAALGQPLLALPAARFRQLVKAAGVKPIKFHGLRHTSATLLLATGVPVQVVAQ